MKRYRPMSAVLAGLLFVTACGGDDGPTEPQDEGTGDEATEDGAADDPAGEVEEEVVAVGDGDTGLEYWLWDSSQLPAYEACAEAFIDENPNIAIEIRQMGWGDYWNAIVTGLVSGEAPDVFTNHLSRYPEFAANGQLLALDDYVERDGVDLDQYFEGLTDLWVDMEGDRYGLPKDWDTIGLFYNTEHLEEAGYSPDDIWELEWNPDDGGTYEEFVAAMTVDANGVRGNEDGFDPDDVAVYGLGYENAGGGGHGQEQWSVYAASAGWEYTDAETWGESYNYGDQEFVDMVTWFRGLIEKGFMPPLEEALGGVGPVESFAAGNYAAITAGSWMTQAYFGVEGVEAGLGPSPIGPSGQRASMFNGLADSIYVGTDHPDESWEWVRFLASSACQDLVAEEAVVFPAIPSSLEIANDRFAEDGIDISPFTTHVEEGTTILFPITDNASEVYSILEPTFDSIFSFEAEPDEALTQANDQINALFD